MRSYRHLTYLLCAAALGATGCDSGAESESEEPSSEDLAEGLLTANKADGGAADAIRSYSRLIELRDAPAQALYNALDAADAYSYTYAGNRVLVARGLGCVSNGATTFCQIAARPQAVGNNDYGVAFRTNGKRSTAASLFNVLAASAPASGDDVATPWFHCQRQQGQRTVCAIAEPVEITLEFTNLENLGSNFVYEGWAISDGPLSTGRFAGPGDRVQVIPASVAAADPLYVLTIEPRRGDDPTPAATHVLAGGLALGTDASLDTAHPAALGTDFGAASGGFILATPTSPATDDETQGIWFVDPAAGAPSLDLPELPAGWAYEGWVVTANGPVSTGRFTSTTGPDADGAGAAAGPNDAPPFPGQDFVDPALDLVGATIVVSVEPEPDDSPAPFAIKPLVTPGASSDTAPSVQGMTNTYANRPHGVARLGGGAITDRGQVWTADRVSGQLTVVDVASTRAVRQDFFGGEPMYVNYSDAADLVLVGDRRNNLVVALDPTTGARVGSASVPAGVFHQWIAPGGTQLWVNSDIDRSTSVVDVTTMEVVATIPMPAELADTESAKPHDVFVDPDGGAAFVSYLGFGDDDDWVVRFDTTTFAETHRMAVGMDPHLFAIPGSDVIYVPCQDTEQVLVLNRADLAQVADIAVPGAHGIIGSPDGASVYVTNLPGAGPEGVFGINTATNSLIRAEGADTPMVGKPHNLAMSDDGANLYVTHSGPTSTLLSVMDVDAAGPVLNTTVQVGLNPFGLGFVPAN